MREMYSLQQQGVALNIFSLMLPKHSLVHEQAQELLPLTIYSPFLSRLVLQAQLHFLGRSARRYLKALARLIWQTYREPRVLLLAVALFPKIVYFSKVLKELGIDHVHAHFVWLEGLAAGVAQDLTGITFTLHPHAFGLFGRDRISIRRELENTTRIITVSEFHRQYIADLCPQIDPAAIEVVHYGVDTALFRPFPNKPPAQRVRILAVGRLVEKKGFEYLVEACGVLAGRGIPFECQIVGAGYLQEQLQARITELALDGQVRLAGQMGQADILGLYQSSDLFALPCVRSRSGDQDGMPNVLIEAMACELPVVTTPLTGIPELVHHNKNGLLVPEHDAKSLADALERLITVESLRLRLGRQARETVLKEFQIQQTAAQMAAIFRKVSGRHPQPDVGEQASGYGRSPDTSQVRDGSTWKELGT